VFQKHQTPLYLCQKLAKSLLTYDEVTVKIKRAMFFESL